MKRRVGFYMPHGKVLVFVNNFDSGVLPTVKDFAGREPSRGTDGCKLSLLTSSPVGTKKEWKRFIRELGIPARFVSRNEFSSEFGTGVTTFPAILIQTGKDLALVVSAGEINQCTTLEDLISLVRSRFARIK
jgi:hypothetical protein